MRPEVLTGHGIRKEKLSKTKEHATEEHGDFRANGHK